MNKLRLDKNQTWVIIILAMLVVGYFVYNELDKAATNRDAQDLLRTFK